MLPSSGRDKHLFSDLLKLYLVVNSDDFDLDRINPLLEAALAENLVDALIWDQVYKATAESTPPSRPIASSLQQTPRLQNTSSFANSSEQRKYVDKVLKWELGPLYVGVHRFREAFFGQVEGLETASQAVFEKCKEGSDPLFGSKGWSKWPADPNESDVLAWFNSLIPKLEEYAKDCNPSDLDGRRKLLAQPTTPLPGSTGKRKMNIGFVNNDFKYNPELEKDFRYRWSHILVPGKLKENSSADIPSEAWIDLATYVREVLSAQDARRFALGFTLCGSLMRIWEFDRLGGIASEKFDINEDGLQFVSTILGFLRMDETQLGFDPTIKAEGGERYIEIGRGVKCERLIIDHVMMRARCIAGRATTCWKAHRKEYPHVPLVIKDSWQYTEREEEGELLRKATNEKVVNVARYYHHETVQVLGMDDIQRNVRKGLDITTADNFRPELSMMPPNKKPAGTRQRSNSSTTSRKRSAGSNAPLPSGKRSCSASSTKASTNPLPNRKLPIGSAWRTGGLHCRTRVLTRGRLPPQRHLDQ